MKRYDNFFNKIMDYYLEAPILFDIVICLILFGISRHYPLFSLKTIDKSNQLNIVSNLIGTCVSLAGFILAALTIIVTFKANIDSKNKEGNQPFESALQLLFTTGYYNDIVKIFKGAIKEFALLFVILYITWVNADSISVSTFYSLTQAALLSIAVNISRSLHVLFLVLKAENKK